MQPAVLMHLPHSPVVGGGESLQAGSMTLLLAEMLACLAEPPSTAYHGVVVAASLPTTGVLP